jgi:hypothetical protein
MTCRKKNFKFAGTLQPLLHGVTRTWESVGGACSKILNMKYKETLGEVKSCYFIQICLYMGKMVCHSGSRPQSKSCSLVGGREEGEGFMTPIYMV